MLAVLFFLQITSAPVLEHEKNIVIPSGHSINQIANLLKKNSIIYSPILFKVIARQKNLSPKSGSYYFEESQNLFKVIERLEKSDYGKSAISVTIPEGSTNKQLLSIFEKSGIGLDINEFKTLISNKEGYLFPDTYSFFIDTKNEDIILELEKTFQKKFTKSQESKTIEKTDKEIVIMASLLEKEATKNLEEKQIVAGILWKRISKGNPLQVDAPFLYERGQGSADLSIKDLQKDSRYNTYVNKGLTPTAIGNPGYDSLYAASHPFDTKYYFYLHGDGGKIHYGVDHDEHLKNKRMYLI